MKFEIGMLALACCQRDIDGAVDVGGAFSCQLTVFDY